MREQNDIGAGIVTVKNTRDAKENSVKKIIQRRQTQDQNLKRFEEE